MQTDLLEEEIPKASLWAEGADKDEA